MLAELQSSIQFGSHGANTAFVNHVQLDADNPTGKFKSYNIASIERPSKNQFFVKQLELVKLQAIKAKRQDCMNEILSQLTPALPYFAALTGMQPNKHKWTYELLELTYCVRVKQLHAV